MPWSETTIMDERYCAIRELLTGNFSKTELCQSYNISRPTLDKWINRYHAEGFHGLFDRSSKPISCPHKTPTEIENLILDLNQRKGWQAHKIHSHLGIRFKNIERPSQTTIHNILDRAGRTNQYNRRQKHQHPGKPAFHPLYPNQFWTMDYKGQFKTRDGIYCYPLTVRCDFSSMILCADGHYGPRTEDAMRSLTRVFREYGLPEVIVSDNGGPFASSGINGITHLNVWWTELGIKHLRIEPASPGQNPRHERMHREMKRLCTRPPELNLNAQNRRLRDFVHDYNEELGTPDNEDVPPVELYEKSDRIFPELIKLPEYPSHWETRLVSSNGGFRWDSKRVPVTMCLENKLLGLEEVDDKLFKVFFYDRFIGFFDANYSRIEDEPSRFFRQHVNRVP